MRDIEPNTAVVFQHSEQQTAMADIMLPPAGARSAFSPKALAMGSLEKTVADYTADLRSVTDSS